MAKAVKHAAIYGGPAGFNRSEDDGADLIQDAKTHALDRVELALRQRRVKFYAAGFQHAQWHRDQHCNTCKAKCKPMRFLSAMSARKAALTEPPDNLSEILMYILAYDMCIEMF